MTSYAATTHGVRVTVRPVFLPEQSDADESRFVWAYRVRIQNVGDKTVRLMRRTWEITDATGKTERVHGSGVVGEQPTLPPGGAFDYTSGTPLGTSSGFMVGTYHMIDTLSGAAFDVAVPAFSLDSPDERGPVH